MYDQSKLDISSSQFTYTITNVLSDIELDSMRYVLIVDKNVVPATKKLFLSPHLSIYVEISEDAKTLDTVQGILENLADARVNKSDLIVAVGGGALQDLVTLVASLYMRGIDWIYVPTTLMSMLDSCIGGKSSINLGTHKNVVGNFFPPRQVYIEPNYLKTLELADIAAGISEGVKICFASGKETAQNFQELINAWQASNDDQTILQAIFLSLRTKKWFVEIDEFDKKERKLLNFGHSFGHALESGTNFAIPHGIGVFVGMEAAIHHSGNALACNELTEFIVNQAQSVSQKFPKFELNKNQFLRAIKSDKKNTNSHQILILPDSKGVLNEAKIEIHEDNFSKCLSSTIRALDKLGFKYEVL
jgi:3-dehydroquinate synthase